MTSIMINPYTTVTGPPCESPSINVEATTSQLLRRLKAAEMISKKPIVFRGFSTLPVMTAAISTVNDCTQSMTLVDNWVRSRGETTLLLNGAKIYTRASASINSIQHGLLDELSRPSSEPCSCWCISLGNSILTLAFGRVYHLLGIV